MLLVFIVTLVFMFATLYSTFHVPRSMFHVPCPMCVFALMHRTDGDYSYTVTVTVTVATRTHLLLGEVVGQTSDEHLVVAVRDGA